MFDAISRLFSDPEPRADDIVDPELDVAALLVHLINIDGEISDDERRTVRGVLIDQFELGDQEVDQLMKKARQKDAEAVDLYQFTSSLKQLDMETRIEIIRMMWAVVYADDRNHELEDNMVWRVAELIGVSARDRTTLRARMRGA